MKWSILMVLMLVVAFVLAFATPARSESVVSGATIEVWNVARNMDMADSWYVLVRDLGHFNVLVPSGCDHPWLGTAYVHYVRLDSGAEYRTLFQSGCAYPVLP